MKEEGEVEGEAEAEMCFFMELPRLGGHAAFAIPPVARSSFL